MPVQKGKKRRRPRRRGLAVDRMMAEERSAAAPVKERPGAMRRGWQLSMRVNLAIGVVLALVGVIFSVIPQNGMGTGARLVILLGYFSLAGLYLGKAFRQYRSKRQP